jgi:hypothetical protein
MRDIGTPARKAIYNALFDQVVIDSGKIPIVDEKLDARISETNLYILIGAQDEQEKGNKTNWVGEVDILLTVVNRRKATNTKTIVESITDQIKQILFPTRTTLGVTLESPFQLSWMRSINRDYQFTKVEDGFEIAKRLTYRLRITHN